MSACGHSTSPEYIQVLDDNRDIIGAEGVASDNEGNLSQGALSLPDFSSSDAQKAVVCEVAQKTNTQYSVWWDELIRQGRDDISLHDKTAHNYTKMGKVSKAPNHLGPPISYMEACGAFKPLAMMANPLLGLCWFYHADPASVISAPAPNPLATICLLKRLLLKAWEQVWPYIILVFEGGNVTPLRLLLELHSRYTLYRIPIFTSDEAKRGHKSRISCCPICTYVIKNDSALEPHRYWTLLV